MRVRLLRGDDDNTVLLVYPETRDEHCRVLDTVGCPGGSQGRSRPAGGAYVVTTAAQRERWGLADLAASGRVRVVDEAQALGLLCDGAAGLGAAEAPLAGAAAEVPPPADGRSVASALESVRALAAPGARLEQVLEALEAAELPRPASETLRRSVRALGSDADGGRRGAGPGGDGAGPAVANARAGAVRPGACGAGARPHPRRPRAGQDPPPAGAGGVPADPRPAHRGRRAPQPGSGDRQAARAGRTPGTSPDAHARSLPRRAFGNGQDVAGGGRRRGARPHPRARAAGQGECRVPDPRGRERRHRAHRRGSARGRGRQSGLHSRRARPGGIGRRRRAARRPGPRAPERVPGRVPPGPVRSVRGAVGRDGDRCRRDTGAGTHAARGDRAAGVQRAGEARHRAAVPADPPVRPVPGHAAAGARSGGAGPRGGIRHRPGRTGRGGGPGGLVGAGAGGIVGGAAAAGHRRAVADGGVHGRCPLRGGGDPPGDSEPHE